MASLLVTVTGRDRPGLAAELFGRLGELELPVADVEQLQIHGRLLLCVLLGPTARQRANQAAAALAKTGTLSQPTAGGQVVGDEEVELTVAVTEDQEGPAVSDRQLVTLLGDLDGRRLGALFATVAATGANVDRIVRLAAYPVTSYELTVSGGDATLLRRAVAEQAACLGVDAAVQRAGLHRRARHLIVMDVDSTLVQGEIIDLLAARAGKEAQVKAVTEAAMAGDMDFETALRQRVALLAGLPASALDEVRRGLILAPGAATLVRTLRRLGFVTAVVSGGFLEVIGPLVGPLGIDQVAANSVEVHEGRLTGRLVGPVLDRAGKAAALARFAAASGIPLARTVAVGDGANDLDMLSVAGLGIAFNAKPLVRSAADTALSVPYLDAVLFLLGIPRVEVEAADQDPGD